MKKYGKYEKQPEGVPVKQTNVKNTLLQTYLTSLLCLVLCVTMFLGTSYAWFTSEVNNEGNEIYIGMLDVELEKKLADGTWASLSEKENGANKTKLFNKNIRWEPGYTALETLKVVDTGNLAFNYELTFTDGTISGTTTATLQDIAQWFDVWVFDHQASTTYTAPVAYAEVSEDTGWTKAGTLAEVLDGKAVFYGGMNESDVVNGNPEHTYTIALHMNGENTSEDQQNKLNALMGQKIGLSVKLVATQRSSESDGFGNGSYDAGIVVTNKEQLIAALVAAEDGDTIVVTAGTYDFTENDMVISKGITLQAADPENKPVFVLSTSDGTGSTTDMNYGIKIDSGDVALKNLKLTLGSGSNGSGYAVYIGANGTDYYSDIVIDGCDFYGFDHCITMFGNNVTIQNCVLDESAANDQGNIIYVWGTSGKLTIRNNHFIGAAQRKHGISFYYQSAASQIAGEILIEGNTFENVYKGIVHESNMTYTDVGVKILNNTFKNCLKKPVAIDNGSFVSYIVNGNVFQGIATSNDPLLDNKANAVINANENYWDSASPDWATVISGSNVTVENYYTDEGKTNLVRK